MVANNDDPAFDINTRFKVGVEKNPETGKMAVSLTITSLTEADSAIVTTWYLSAEDAELYGDTLKANAAYLRSL